MTLNGALIRQCLPTPGNAILRGAQGNKLSRRN